MSGARVLCVAGAAAAVAVPAAALLRADPERPAPRTLAVAVTSPAGAAELATGFAAGGDRVVSVAHVLDAGGAVTVGGRRARVVRVDRRDDLALLAVPGLRAPRARLRTGATGAVRLLLRDGAQRASVRRAVTATVRIEPAAPVRRPALELAADVRSGDSGSALVDRDGRVAGVLFATSTARAHTAYAVDATAVAALLR
jgi:S1-C subfamily serine protease